MEMDEFNVLQPAHRERRFQRLFRNVPTTEILLCRFSCAYVSDLGLLLQGHLYVSHNWICFHSNIFGIEKIIEIPVESVVTVSKAHTAKIIPNAVKIKTQGKYYLFGSLISRDNTYRLLFNITARCISNGLHANSKNADARVEAPKVDERTRNVDLAEEDASSLSSVSTTNTSDSSSAGVAGHPAILVAAAAAADGIGDTRAMKPLLETRLYHLNKNNAGAPLVQHVCRATFVQRFLPELSVHGFVTWFYSLPKIFIVLMLCVALLAFLFVCATFLTVRLMYIQNPSLFRVDFVPWSSTKEKQNHLLPRQTLETMDACLGSTLKMVHEAMTQLARVKVQVRNLMVEDSLPASRQSESAMDTATV